MNALPRAIGVDSTTALRAVHERFVAGDVDATVLESAAVRPVVAQSWLRSHAEGVDPDRDVVGESGVGVRVARMRDAHPLAPALPVIRQLLVEDASTSGVVVAVTDADGTLLWVEGDRDACRRAEAMNFVPGADWSERGAGTNAPGTALALDREVRIHGSEHYARVVQPWSCAAVPVHRRHDGALIGSIDLTGGDSVASAQTLALVRATVVAVENHLALLTLADPTDDVRPPHARLNVLGPQRPRWIVADDTGRSRTVPLTGRHADILVLLSRHPEGLSADHLAMLLDEKDLDVVTVRAEMSRLRKIVGPEYLASRPYRLMKPIECDVDDVYTALADDDVEAALSRYAGPLLVKSVSPAIGRLRTEMSASLRHAVLSSGQLPLLRTWLDLPDGRDDHTGWRMLYKRADPGSAHQARAKGRLAGLDFELS
jgi:GAF domain-containing protein